MVNNINFRKSTSAQLDVLVLGGFVLVKLILPFFLVNTAYSLHRDEFLHLDQAHHLAWGFQSVPPLTSIFAVIIQFLGGSEAAVRLVTASIGALTLIFTWKIVAEFKGRLYAKALSAIALICCAVGRLDLLFQPNAFDILSWTAIYFFLIRYFNTRANKYLYLTGVALGIGFLNKYSICFLIAGLIPALFIANQRKIYASKHLYGAGLIALLIMLPNLLWQYHHHFPVVGHMKELARTQLDKINRVDFLKDQLLYYFNIIFIVLAGLWALVLSKTFSSYRWIVIGFVISLALFTWFRAKAYYAAGLYPVIIAAGCSYLALQFNQGWKRKYLRALIVILPLALFSVTLKYAYPVLSPQQIVGSHDKYARVGALRWEDGLQHDLPQDFADMLAWKEMAALTDIAYAKVKDKSALLVRADNYGEAGAINYYSKFKNINAVTYNADYLYWFKMDKPIKHVILVRESNEEDPQRKKEQPFFKKITKIGEVTVPYAREKGAAVFLLEDATIDINSRVQTEIEEEKHDH
ncbi:ArnT family glycosyltransferase [Pedobacter soli]|uniref:Dolichyl-phosphate-mannose-protein mannosyltransferase n=1 Tax=Pedobacter soli TaxID=390242 RepID=A0A1G6LXV6_9SPHI|nr:glycosyltransferase family 39 protein [Pedobacter soli]SDC48102.1 Dolichyl-phosphate-mannose-protein mannosyltransferase [Pedobacter soli]